MKQIPLYRETAVDQKSRRLIRELPPSERPLHRLQQVGARSLSTTELLAVILGTPDAMSMAEDILVTAGTLIDLARWQRWQLEQVNGVGEATAGRILAALELGRRAIVPHRADERPCVQSPADAANLLMPEMCLLEQEHLRLILLDTRNRVIHTPVVYVGSLNSSVVRIAELLRCALIANAAAMIVAHNHPSGDPSPSPEDIRVTRQVVSAGKLMDIQVLDHVIIGHGRFTSLKERGLGFDA